MERTTLLEALKRVAPGLAAKAFTPIFSCFCFTGKAVYTYDDVVALRVPLDWEVTGGINGDVLSGWLGSCHGKDVEVVESLETSMKIKCGRSTVTLAVTPKQDFVMQWPKADEAKASIPVSKEFVDAVARCVVSMGRDPSAPKQLGITVEFLDGAAALYSTTSYHCSMSSVKMTTKGAPDAVQLPPKFCDLLASIKDTPNTLVLADSWAEVRYESGLRMFTRTGGQPDAALFHKVFSDDTRNAIKKGLKDVPKGMADAVDRSLVILGTTREKMAKMSVKDGVLTMATTADAGDVRDKLAFDGHGDIGVKCDMPMLKASLPKAERIAILDTCVAVRGPGFTHIMAAAPKEEAK